MMRRWTLFCIRSLCSSLMDLSVVTSIVCLLKSMLYLKVERPNLALPMEACTDSVDLLVEHMGAVYNLALPIFSASLFAHSLTTFLMIFPLCNLGTSSTNVIPPTSCLCFATLIFICA
jgi:hypothetical protein